MATPNSVRSQKQMPNDCMRWEKATTFPAISSRWMGKHYTSQARQITFQIKTNVVPLQVSMGAYNSYQQGDSHSYWEFKYLGTNWVHPLYELPFTGGFPDKFGGKPDAFQDGEIGALQSIVPGSGPAGVKNSPLTRGDDPNLPRDPDKFDGDIDAQREFRQRGIPSGLANEIFLDVYERLASFEPH